MSPRSARLVPGCWTSAWRPSLLKTWSGRCPHCSLTELGQKKRVRLAIWNILGQSKSYNFCFVQNLSTHYCIWMTHSIITMMGARVTFSSLQCHLPQIKNTVALAITIAMMEYVMNYISVAPQAVRRIQLFCHRSIIFYISNRILKGNLVVSFIMLSGQNVWSIEKTKQ